MSKTPHHKLRVGILFGGKSAEHEVSIQSARNVLGALDKDRFEPVLIGVDKQGRWYLNHASELLLNSTDLRLSKLNSEGSELTLLPGKAEQGLVQADSAGTVGAVDVVFPILHGPMGEDGTMQGFLEIAGIPYVGPSVLGAAIGMDKDVMKRLLRDAGIKITPHVAFRANQINHIDLPAVINELGLPLFVKPANMGSSVGVSKAHDEHGLREAVKEAFRFDRKIIIEQAVVGDEVECAVLGNDDPKASVPGRIIPQHEFYSYEARYIDEHGAALEIPAEFDADLTKRIQAQAIKAYQVLEGRGMARVDMFVTKSGDIIMNEINTIPGFTKISMYPKLWEASGLSYRDLITNLIELAVDTYQEQKKLATTYIDSKPADPAT